MNNFIGLKDALKMCDKKALYEETIKLYPWADDPQGCAKLTLSFVEKLMSVEPSYHEDNKISILLLEDEMDEDYDQNHYPIMTQGYSTCVAIIDRCLRLKKYKPIFASTMEEQYKSWNHLERQKFLEKTRGFNLFGGEHYAFDLEYTEYVLGYNLPQSLIKYFGLEKFLANVLFEMTFLGFDINEVKDEQDRITSEMDAAYKKITSLDKDEHQIKDVDQTEGVGREDLKITDVTKEIVNASPHEDYKALSDENCEKCLVYNTLQQIKIYNMIVDDYNNEFSHK